ncbi:hypothetical protein K469DRAFT_712256 [Zopfia rhizophila CBS 207.26]|uniref:DUF218 domain-containing protein n=1 Tax=Zopfia rhizophila CBS 207.26 TaxID=1314779 RepID=A0A6A6EQQ9_9PEZI|nr:hypothetical protein K469DRAFT_712256 [Zopfia rhizophila CBS 207.26]
MLQSFISCVLHLLDVGTVAAMHPRGQAFEHRFLFLHHHHLRLNSFSSRCLSFSRTVKTLSTDLVSCGCSSSPDTTSTETSNGSQPPPSASTYHFRQPDPSISMNLATPSRTLPKSNYHHSIASASTGRLDSAAPALYESALHQDLENGHQSTNIPNFAHPHHAIPPRSFDGVDNLIIVCCHAIFHPNASSPSFPLSTPYDERNWHLAPFQKSDPRTGKPGEHETFLSHISAGLDVLAIGSWADTSILVLSGGVTKKTLTSLSEARSYYNAALAQALSEGHKHGGRVRKLFDDGRILLEEHATDSFQNLLFSILLFWRTTGAYPKRIRVITHAFKAKRFLDLHAPAIRWPVDRIRVQGIDPAMSSVEYDDTVKGEERFGYGLWREDPLGVGEALDRKRKQRGWDKGIAQKLSDGLERSVKQLLNGEVTNVLPWTESITSTVVK